MSLTEILALALALSLDACAVSLAAAAAGFAKGPRAVFRLSFHFGLFQFLMPILGWGLGNTVAPIIGHYDHWIAFALLTFLAVRMFRAGLKHTAEHSAADPSRGLALLMLSTATSIDALAVGLSLGMLKVAVWYPSVIIGVVTAAMCVFAIACGNRIGHWLGNRAQIIGALVLFAIALNIVLTHHG